MKKLILPLLLMWLSVTAFSAGQYYKAVVYMKDGSVKHGLATDVMNEKEFIVFKINEKAKDEKIEFNLVKKMVYTIDNENYELVYIKVYAGWKQVEIKGPIWLQLVKKGPATLYVTTTVMGGAPTNKTAGTATFHDYYIMRDGEPAAKLFATISTLNNNQTFRAKAPLYFADYPELAEKIKNKTYTWENLEEVVDIYNKWAQNKKK
ncbi:MAG TPA: hypothetical protein VHO68_08615 [Bacteroidales bacterium]|jgi:hypothetical protein|nr:hypothetical protein [Bacteroidales bacterium]